MSTPRWHRSSLALASAAFVCGWACTAGAGPRADGPPETPVPLVYAVEVDGVRVTGRAGERLRVTCAGSGTSHTVVVQPLDPQVYDAHGVRFRWPVTAHCTAQHDGDWHFVSCELPGGGLVTLEVRDASPTPPDAVDAAVTAERTAWIDAYKPAGLRGARTGATTRMIAGAPRTGASIEARVGTTLQRAEVFVLAAGPRTVVCTLEWDAGSDASARRELETLIGSLELP